MNPLSLDELRRQLLLSTEGSTLTDGAPPSEADQLAHPLPTQVAVVEPGATRQEAEAKLAGYGVQPAEVRIPPSPQGVAPVPASHSAIPTIGLRHYSVPTLPDPAVSVPEPTPPQQPVDMSPPRSIPQFDPSSYAPSIQAARQSADQARLMSNLGRAGAEFSGALGHYKPDMGLYDDFNKQATEYESRPMKDLELAQLSQEWRLKNEEMDPNSATNQNFRRGLAGTAFAKMLGPAFNNFTRADMEKILPQAVSQQKNQAELGLATRKQTEEEGYHRATLQNDTNKINAELDKQNMLYGAGTALTGPALDQAAVLFHTTGQLPASGMGPAGAKTRAEIQNRAAEIFTNSSIPGAKADYDADKASLAGLTKQADYINGAEATALKNLDGLVEQARGVADVGSPYFNSPIRKLEQRLFGDPRMAAFTTARQVTIPEVARVLTTGSGGQLSNDARAETGHLLDPDLTFAQLLRARDILRQDMANRAQAAQQNIQAVRNRLAGGVQNPAAQTSPAPQAGPQVQAPPPSTQTGSMVKVRSKISGAVVPMTQAAAQTLISKPGNAQKYEIVSGG